MPPQNYAVQVAQNAALAAAVAGVTQPQPVGAANPRYVPGLDRETYTIKVTGAVESCFERLRIIYGLVYVHGDVAGGVPADPAGTCYIGLHSQLLPDARGIGDTATPYLINETAKSELQPARLFVKGTAGDIVELLYRAE